MSGDKFPLVNKPILQQVITFHRARLRHYEEIEVSCTSCVHFVQIDQRCKKFEAAVPEEIVVKGCDEWVYDDIPF